jgi:predicted ATPase
VQIGERPIDEHIVGRDEELQQIVASIASDADGPSALVVEGEPGIGKTTLWREALRVAGEQGSTVLSCRPASSETRLSFAGLADLLEPVLGDLRPQLPRPQRRALDVALLLRDPNGPPPDERAVGAALTTALRTLASTTPVLVAIDDVQWLDASTAAALSFAMRQSWKPGPSACSSRGAWRGTTTHRSTPIGRSRPTERGGFGFEG